jgi:uncharacterized protein YjiS (DUF1127 family)
MRPDKPLHRDQNDRLTGMETAMQTLSMKAPTTLAAAIWRTIKRLAPEASPTRDEQVLLQSLARLDDYLLADIGIGRREISSVVGIGKQARRRANLV